MHFWCQIKCSQDFGEAKQTESYTPQPKHLEYWLKQPIPVLVFLVPDLRSDASVPYFICSAVEAAFPRPVTKRLNSIAKVSNPCDLAKFLQNDMAHQAFLWDLKDGKVGPLRTPKPSYILQIRRGLAQCFEPQLRQSVIFILDALSADICRRCEEAQKEGTGREETAAFLELCRPYPEALDHLVRGVGEEHFTFFETVGDYFDALGEHQIALERYERALNILKTDPTYPQSPNPLEEHVVRVDHKMCQAREKLEVIE